MRKKIILIGTKKTGHHWIYEDELTDGLLDAIKRDKKDEMGWKKYHKKLKEMGFEVE